MRTAVGASRTVGEGVATFDVSNPSNKEALKEYRNKVVYDPFDDDYKYIVFDKDTKQYSFKPYKTIEEVKIAFADSDPAGTTSSNVAQETEEDKKKRLEKSYGFYLPDVIENIQEKDKEIPIGGTGA